jgi:DNA-binding GntR family transcriptional regulator
MATLASKLYESIKEDIVNLRYGENEILSEQMMANKYEVSKTTAREALSLLCQDGYLVKYPSRGYFVKSICLKEYQDVIQLRLLIEVGAVDLVIDRATDDEIRHLYQVLDEKPATHENFYELNRAFHYGVAKLTGNKRLADTVYELVCQVSRPASYINFGKGADELQSLHRMIIDALLRRNKADARRLMEMDLIPVTGVPKGLFTKSLSSGSPSS